MTETNVAAKTIDPARLRDPVRIRSPHPPEEVHRRLGEVVQAPSFSSLLGVTGLAGTLRPPEFQVAWHSPVFRNSFKPVLQGFVTESGTGAELVGRFRMATLVRAVLTAWFGLVVLGLAASFSQGSDGTTIAIELALLAFGVAMVRLGLWLAREHRARIVSALCDAVDGTLI